MPAFRFLLQFRPVSAGIVSVLLVLSACHQPVPKPAAAAAESTPAPAAPEPATATGPVFRFSTAAPLPHEADAINWCDGPFGEAQVINAEKENTMRRYFYLRPGVTKIAIGPSGATTTYLIRRMPSGDVEIFTGANFPECLSIPTNFSPQEGGPVIHYRNHKNVTFSMEMRDDSGHTMITIELPKGSNYLMMVNPCQHCP